MRPECLVEECHSESKHRGWCDKHYTRWKRYKTTDLPERRGIVHGTTTGYGNYGCRCDACRAAKTASQRMYRAENPQYRFRQAIIRHEARAILAGVESREITEQDWSRLLTRHSGRCAYCKIETDVGWEHVVPLARGGWNALGNILPVCRSCNTSKSDQLLVEWRTQKREMANRGGKRNLRKTHCVRGHEYTPENTYFQKSGLRECRTCMRTRNRENMRRHYWAKKDVTKDTIKGVA